MNMNKNFIESNLIKIDETSLNRILSKHFKDGFIIITSERSEITDPEESNKRFKQLKIDITNAGYSYIPVWGGFTETNPETGEKYDNPSLERALIVPNHKVNANEPYEDDSKLYDLGIRLTNKYNQECFLYKPQENNKNKDTRARFVDGNGNVIATFDSVSINDLTQKYFTKISKTPKKIKPDEKIRKTDKRFSFIEENNEIYFHKPPKNATEAYERFGEQFLPKLK